MIFLIEAVEEWAKAKPNIYVFNALKLKAYMSHNSFQIHGFIFSKTEKAWVGDIFEDRFERYPIAIHAADPEFFTKLEEQVRILNA